MRSITRPIATAGATLCLVLALAACGDDGGGDKKDSDDKASETESSQSDGTESSTGTEATDDVPTDPTVSAPTEPTGPVDASTKEFCAGLKGVGESVAKVQGQVPTEAQWKAIQESYEELGEIGAPDGVNDRQREGFEVIVDAVTGLSYADAKKQFGDKGGDSIPGVSPEEDEKANEFFEYATTVCADSLQ